MAALDVHQRCWNHEAREAVCRCVSCSRSYCRECVSEHEGRLLCAACLALTGKAKSARRSLFRRAAPALMIAGGLLLAWLTYWAMGELVINTARGLHTRTSAERMFQAV